MIGSSPLSRGIQEGRAAAWLSARIIPALAGNTLAAGYASADWGDHPRSRGEYANAAINGIASAGSSPLSRGIRRDFLPFRDQNRIIPALAGNTWR